MSSRVLKDLIQKFSDPTYSKCVFTKCNDINNQDFTMRWIVVLEKVSDSATNENRKDVIDYRYAKFGANKLKVIEIFDINDPKVTKDNITHGCLRRLEANRLGVNPIRTLVYQVNKVTLGHHYYRCTEFGIDYFKTIQAAYFYINIPLSYSGPAYGWYEDGVKHSAGRVKNGKKTGKWIMWDPYGNICFDGLYLNGKEHGKWQFWRNGEVQSVKYHSN